MTSTKAKLHRDGTVTYWSVYRQQWIERAEYMPDAELAAMNAGERGRVIRHVEAKC